MKTIMLLFVSALLLSAFIAGRIIDEQAMNILKQLKLSEDDAQTQIFSDISGPAFYFPNIKELKKVAVGDRDANFQVIAKYVKEFTTTEEFKKRYNEYRESLKPSAPEKPKSAEELKNQNREELKKSIEEMKVTKSQMPEDQQVMFEETIVMLEDQLKQLNDPDNPMYSAEFDNIIQETYQQQVELHEQQVGEWEKKYPANNPNEMIKHWLTNFIEKTKDVDFNAETVIDEYGILVFDKQEYERKDNLWKLCYRAGNETTGSARRFAQTWLGELNKGQI